MHRALYRFSLSRRALWYLWVAGVLAVAFGGDGHANAQAFFNDEDGLLDVGEVSEFPADPAAVTGELDLS